MPKNNKGRKSNTISSFKTKNASSQSRRRTLPDLPKREERRSIPRESSFRYFNERNGYSETSRRDEKNNSTVKGKGNKSKKRSGGIVQLAGGALGSLFSLVKGGKKSDARIIDNETVSKKRNRAIQPLIMIIFAVFFIYIIAQPINFFSKKAVSFDVLSYGTVDTPKSANAVIVRSEKVYAADKGGVISYDAADGEKVKKGTVVCSIKDKAVVEQMQSSLDSINEQIMKIQSERKDISVYSEDIKKYNTQIKNTIDESAMDYAYMKLGNIYELENTVSKQLDTRNQYLLTEDSSAISDLVSQKKEQENKLNENISNLAAEQSGIVSYYIDGLEAELTPENMAEIPKSRMDDTVKAQSSFRSNVKAGDPAFKIVDSNTWYMVSYIPNDYMDDWEKGDSVTVYVKDNEGKKHKLDASVEEIKDNGKGESFVILRLTRDMADFMNMRNVIIETENTGTGFKIPNNAIVEETLMKIPANYVDSDGNVLKVNESGTTKVAVSISGNDPNDSGYCYTPVQMGVINVGDTIQIPDGEDTFVISDVLNTKGIYVVNTGIAEFKTINLTNSVSNSTHTILDPGYNTNIYIYDRIMTDPSDVSRQEMVYE